MEKNPFDKLLKETNDLSNADAVLRNIHKITTTAVVLGQGIDYKAVVELLAKQTTMYVMLTDGKANDGSQSSDQ